MSKSPILFAAALAAALGATAAAAQSANQGSPGAQNAPSQDVQANPDAARSAHMRRLEGVRTMPYPAPAASTGGKAAQHPMDERHCLRQTGSHIPPADGKCIPMPGRAYDKQDIDRTGENRLGPALRKLDPSVGGR
jgi:hypothetical protein